MADVPNWWGQPDSLAFAEHEVAMRGMMDRDYNHPSVFSYVLFNETWGLRTKVTANDERYLPETQRKVVSVYRLAKTLDGTRLIEDNSICCGAGHTETDLNTWHEYLPGWRWAAFDKVISDSTYPGSPHHFEKGWVQGRQPMLNSEFGNVWGYTGSTGDVDWSWDYKRAVDAFRRHPKIAGWLYTEHHDVINEWNGYWRFDRTWKETGFSDLAPGMSLRDLHSPLYIAVGDSLLARDVTAGASVDVPLYASFLTPATTFGDSLTVRGELRGWTTFGEQRTYGSYVMRIAYRPWMSGALPPMRVTMPGEPGCSCWRCASRMRPAPSCTATSRRMWWVVQRPRAACWRMGPACARRAPLRPRRRRRSGRRRRGRCSARSRTGQGAVCRVPHCVAGGPQGCDVASATFSSRRLPSG